MVIRPTATKNTEGIGGIAAAAADAYYYYYHAESSRRVGFSSEFVCLSVYPHDISKTDGARITKLDTQITNVLL